MYYAGIAETIGINVKVLTPEQIKEIWPLCNTDGVIGAIQHVDDGYIQPADPHTGAGQGRSRQRCPPFTEIPAVNAIEQDAEGLWHITTDKGEITAEHVISCTGSFARKTGEMVGLNIPVIPVEHQFIVTEPHPEILKRHEQGLPEMGVLRGC